MEEKKKTSKRVRKQKPAPIESTVYLFQLGVPVEPLPPAPARFHAGTAGEVLPLAPALAPPFGDGPPGERGEKDGDAGEYEGLAGEKDGDAGE